MKVFLMAAVLFSSHQLWAACAATYESYGSYPNYYVCISFTNKDKPIGKISCERKRLVKQLIGDIDREIEHLTDSSKIEEARAFRAKFQEAVDNCAGESKTPILDRLFGS